MKKTLKAILEPLVCAIFVPIWILCEAWHRRQERIRYGTDNRMIRSIGAALDREDEALHEKAVQEALEAEKIL